jgi:hypothetical protein
MHVRTESSIPALTVYFGPSREFLKSQLLAEIWGVIYRALCVDTTTSPEDPLI